MNVEWSAKGGDTTVWLGKEFTDSGETSVASIQREWAETMNDDNLYPFNFELGLMWDLVKAVDQQKGEEFQRYLQQKWENNKSQFLPSRFFEGWLYSLSTRSGSIYNSHIIYFFPFAALFSQT